MDGGFDPVKAAVTISQAEWKKNTSMITLQKKQRQYIIVYVTKECKDNA